MGERRTGDPRITLMDAGLRRACQMGGAARKNRVRDLVLLVAVAAIPMAIARWEVIGPFGVFAAGTVLLAALATILVIRWAARLARRDLGRRVAEGRPKDLAPESLAAILVALA